MEQIIIYIIISVILLFLRGAGKQQKKQQPQEIPNSPQSTSTKPVSSFEELLRQLQEVKSENTQQSKVETQDDAQNARLQNSKRFKVEQDYFSYESEIPNQGLNDTERNKDQHEDAYVLKTVGKSRFRKQLQSRSAVRDAIIFNEIINRKHF